MKILAQAFLEANKGVHAAARELARAKMVRWEMLKKLRRCLEKREYDMLKLRVHGGANLEEVGKIYGMTRERIRQIEAKAFHKLTVISEGGEPGAGDEARFPAQES